MASGSEDEQQGAWYFGSNSYVLESSSESEEEPHTENGRNRTTTTKSA